MNYLLAVSGGVDSVVLLDMFHRMKRHIIVAHVDHSIRGDESAADARFVRALAKQYKVPFVSTELHLSRNASEEMARHARYNFLFDEAAKHHATIVTAHHQDDVIETIAINLYRGTGWRGLTALNRPGIERPLLSMTKSQIYHYALQHQLEWVEDATNRQTVYLRNQFRHLLGSAASIDTTALVVLRARQIQLRHDIEQETKRIIAKQQGNRHFMTMIPDDVARELLGAEIAMHAPRPPRPRLERALHAIKVAAPGTVYQVGDGVQITFTPRKYTITVV